MTMVLRLDENVLDPLNMLKIKVSDQIYQSLQMQLQRTFQ